MNKILTIVIPTYNMERYLERCLNSLIVSDDLMDRLEILVVNDGSKDRSSEIAHLYEEKYPQSFRVIDKENGNYGSCINRGLTEASGKYIKILDADDWFDTANLERLLSLMTETDADCVMTDMTQVDETGETVSTWRYSLPKNSACSLGELTMLPSNELIWMHCVAYKTENLRCINYHQTEGISYTDQEWIYLPMATCKSIYYYPIVVYKYLVGRDGQTMNPAVFKKNFWMEIKGTINMAHQLSQYNHCDDVAYSYLRKRLLGRAMVCYGCYLEKYNMSTCHDEMVALDTMFKNKLPLLYDKLDDLKGIIPTGKDNANDLRFPRFWIVLVWLWRRGEKPKSSITIRFLVKLKKCLT